MPISEDKIPFVEAYTPPQVDDPPHITEDASVTSQWDAGGSVPNVIGDTTPSDPNDGPASDGDVPIAWVDTTSAAPVWGHNVSDLLPDWPEKNDMSLTKMDRCDEERLNKKIDLFLALAKKEQSARGGRMCRWEKTDTVLALTFLAAILIMSACASSVLPRWEPLPNKHGPESNPLPPDYKETSCTVTNVELTDQKMECSTNTYGEWCARYRRGVAAPATSRTFPCLKVQVGYALEGDYGTGLLHTDFIEAENFPECSISSCGGWWSENYRTVQTLARDWTAKLHEEAPLTCHVNRNNPDEVLLTAPSWRQIIGTAGFHAVVWPLLIAKACIWVFLLRRLCHIGHSMFQGKQKVLPNRSEVDPVMLAELDVSGYPTDVKGDERVPEVLLVPPPYDELSGDPPTYTEFVDDRESTKDIFEVY